jgi:hypothetical protein
MSEAATATLVYNLLHEFGYRAEMLDEEAVGSAASGLRFYIQSYGASIQFRCVLGLESGVGSWLEFVNDFNKQMRFVKIYIDEDSLLAEIDCWLDPEDASHVARVRLALDFWELSLAALKERLRSQAEIAPAAIAEAGEMLARG